jgi:DNA topoisomerase-3
MKLFIAEKPSMARSIAKNLPGPHSKKDGYIETGGGYVSWCIGHLLETAPPDAYDPKYEKFPGSFDDLPIVPTTWKLKVADGKDKQVRVIKDLIKKSSEIVNAGDPGREGQLIVDELLEFLGNRKPVKRILLNALDDITVQRELNNLFDNTQFEPLYQAGLGRQRADWLVGMNMSRAYTILGSAAGYRGVLSVGRVQSPTLAIVVRRDREIEAFIPQDYWTIKGLFNSSTDASGTQFWAAWLPPGASTVTKESEDEEDDEDELDNENTSGLTWLDNKNRLIDAVKAKEIASKVQGKTGIVSEAERKRVQEQPPLPFDLSGIQILANAKWGASIKDALDACQSLYEKGYTTYPRTDCRYLPESQHQDAAAILQGLLTALPGRAATINAAQPQLKSRAWNDKKLGEHHAIIPTRQAPDMSQLNPLESKIYNTVALQFLAQFYPPAEVDKAKIIIEVEQEKFMARGRTIVHPGWRDVFNPEDSTEIEQENTSKEDDPSDSKSEALLPALNQGDPATCIKAQVTAKKTSPPGRYTQGTLLDAMKKVHTLVTDPIIKKKLRSVEGIGRSATRASIIDTLLRRNFLETKGKQLFSSQVGKSLIDAMPTKLIDPALTAMWESALDAVATGKAPLEAFMAKQGDWLIKLIEAAKIAKVENLPQGQPYAAKQGAGKYPAKNSASPAKTAVKVKGAKTCSKCKKGQMVERTAKAGPNAGKTFLGCTNYPECKNAEAK